MKRASDLGYSKDGEGNPKRQFVTEKNEDDGDEAHASNAEGDSISAEKAANYIRQLADEKSRLEENNFINAARLLDQEITKVQSLGRMPFKEYKYVNIYREKPIKVTTKVLVPVREHPKFNFVGKLLGPKGNTLKRLQEDTMCKMSILGKKSMRDPLKEEELKASNDPKYAHLNDDLHVEISAYGPPAEAHARMAYALAEIRKYLIPDKNDLITQEQLRELESLNDPNPNTPKSGFLSPRMMKPNPRAAPFRTPPVMRTATRNPVIPPRVIPPKVKVMSILERAKSAMDESYAYEEPISHPKPGYNTYDDSSSYGYEEQEYHPPNIYRKHSSQFEDPSQRWRPSPPTRNAEHPRYRPMHPSGPSMKQPY